MDVAPEKKLMSAIIGKNNGQLPGGNPEEKQKATIDLCSSQCKPLQQKEQKRTISLWKRKRRKNQLPRPENKMDVACKRRNAIIGKKNGRLLGGNLEEKQKATISLCGRQCKPLQKMSKKEQSTCQKEKNNQSPRPENKMDVACQRRNGWVQSSVKNNGQLLGGDPEEKQKQQLKPVQQLVQATQKKKKLSTCQKETEKQSTTWTRI